MIIKNRNLSIFGLTKIENNKIININPLKGGVSCEIYKVDTTDKSYCVKKALRKLKVRKNWYADPIRSYYEFLWLKKVKKIFPHSVPRVVEYNKKRNFLIIQYLDNNKYYNLKDELLKGRVNTPVIVSLSKKISYIHANLKSNYNKKIFQSHNFNFINLRVDPYINELKKKYPILKNKITETANFLIKNNHTVIHGDFTPKNILCSKNKQIILDAEVANYGDPAFDIVSLINHLIIKLIYVNKNKKEFVYALQKSFNIYFSNVTWEDKELIIKRSLSLIPLMILARIDGKSPVEYLKLSKDKNKLRRIALELIEIKNYDFETITNNLMYVK